MCVPDAGVAESVIWPEVVPGKTTELLVPLIVTLIFSILRIACVVLIWSAHRAVFEIFHFSADQLLYDVLATTHKLCNFTTI